MTEATQKKGMSKGCLIGIIVAGVILVMVIVAAVVLWLNKDDVAKFGVTTVVSFVQGEVAKAPPAGVDSASYVAVCNAFTEKFKADEVDPEKLGVFFKEIQSIPSDSKVDSVEAGMFLQAIFDYYPELEDMYVPPEMPEVLDSTMVEEPAETEQ